MKSTIKLEGGVTDAVLTDDNNRLVVFGRRNLVVIDAKTAKEMTRIASLQQPVQLVFAQ